ncbi:FAD-dependent oxidoreductase [Streptomyces sp. NPDC087850]|uniref:FAD-dependent oxidoreductase n=1 Tax=Streptomyces sp. NPDC087850 TaxID=3365809 RepID=UPI0038010275
MERRGAGDDPGARRLTDGTEIPAAAVVRAAGFRVPVPAREAGIAVDARGVITVDAAPRSVPHPEVFAAGDAAGAYGIGGAPARLSCRAGAADGGRGSRTTSPRRRPGGRPRRCAVSPGASAPGAGTASSGSPAPTTARSAPPSPGRRRRG